MRQEGWTPNAQPAMETVDIGPIIFHAPVPDLVENGKDGPKKLTIRADRWHSSDAEVHLLTCVLCGAVVTRNSIYIHNRWHEDNKRPVKRIRSNQQKGE